MYILGLYAQKLMGVSDQRCSETISLQLLIYTPKSHYLSGQNQFVAGILLNNKHFSFLIYHNKCDKCDHFL